MTISKQTKKDIEKGIQEVKRLQIKCCKPDTMFMYNILNTALNEIGWAYANILEEG